MTSTPDFFDRPIVNSPYVEPSRHWELDADDRPTHRIRPARRVSRLATAVPSASAAAPEAAIGSLLAGQGHDTDTEAIDPSPLVERLRAELRRWRGMPDPASWRVSPVTQRLLRHWRDIQAEDTRAIRPFFCQLEAVEAAIWLTEVAPKRGREGRWFLDRVHQGNNFALAPKGTPPGAERPDLLRVAFKLATGAGKTTVMAMLIAWQALNAARGKSKAFTANVLVVAPGITIRDRLRVLQPNDLQNAYDKIGLVPQEMRGDLNRARIVITNYHAFKRRDRFDAATGTRRALEGHGAPLDTAETEGEMVQRVVGDMRDVLVLNDEAHHCYLPRPAVDPEALTGDARKEAEANAEVGRLWHRGLEAIHRRNGVRRVFDLSATPFFISGSNWPEGTLFPWVVSDFSLMDAIECGIVKLPRVPVSDNLPGGQKVIYRDLWGAVGKQLTRMKKDADPQKLPSEVKTALDALHGHYERTDAEWRRAGMDVPPVFIVVCSNTHVSRAVRDYVAGYEYADEAGEIRHQRGALESFRNHDDAGDPLPRPRTVLIDSAALESGDAVDAGFKQAHAAEIEAFRRERIARGDGADDVTEAELLREVMNTIGQAGRLGGQVRCVVSVSMLTEGWDANNVTHILGLRAFGSRLLCEQVMGRALRRMSYAPGDDTDPDGRPLFRTEYADIMGIDGLALGEPRVAPPQPPRKVVRVHAVRPDRDPCEITFPRVEGYRTDLPGGRLAADLPRLKEPFVLTPERTGPTEVHMAGIVGQRHDLTLAHLEKVRRSDIQFRIAQHWVWQKLRDEGGPKPQLFPSANRIVRQWLDPANGHVVFKGGTVPAQLLDYSIMDEVCDVLEGALVDADKGEPVIRPVLDPFAPEGSTAEVDFTTGLRGHMHHTDPRRCHVNWMVGDSEWEVRLAQMVETHPRVGSYVKNHNLGLEVPYVRDGETHRYRPDFLIRLDAEEPTTLMLEVKGYRGHDAMLKAEAARNRWVPAVNRHGGFGRWSFAELRAVHDFRPDLDAAIDAALGLVPAE